MEKLHACVLDRGESCSHANFKSSTATVILHEEEVEEDEDEESVNLPVFHTSCDIFIACSYFFTCSPP